MNERTDLDRVVTDWLRASAPPRAPQSVLSAALDRVAGVGQERPLGGRRFDAWIGRSPRLHWAIVGALLALLLLGAVAGAGALLAKPAVPSLGVRNGWVAFAAGGDRGEDSDIFVARDGEPARRFVGSPGDGLRERCPTFSPDGTRLAYGETVMSAPGGTGGEVERAVVIVKVDAAGMPVGPEVRLPASRVTDVCPKWAPDGQSIAFLADGSPSINREIPEQVVWIGRLDGTLTPVDGWSASCCGSELDWSPDGTAVVALGDLSASLWIIPIDGHEARQVERAGPSAAYEGATWSPDGTRIAVVTDTGIDLPDGSIGSAGKSIVVYKADGSGSPIDLHDGVNAPASLAWSPDGTRLAFVRTVNQDGVEHDEVVSVDPEARDVRVLVSPAPTVRGLAWSPDGTRLLYVADGVATGSLISVLAIDGSSPSVITEGPNSLEFTDHENVSWQPVVP